MAKQTGAPDDEKYDGDYDDYADAMEQSYRARVGKKPVQKKDSVGAIPGVVVRGRGHVYDVEPAGDRSGPPLSREPGGDVAPHRGPPSAGAERR